MQPTTFEYDTELSAVNSILASIGQAPITELEYKNPQNAMAFNLLQEASRDVQAEGWVYNTEKHYPLIPEEGGTIPVPENILRMDISENAVYKTTDVVQRNGVLYDKLRHSNKFEGTLYFDITWLFEFEDLPTVFQRYITAKASTRAATQMVGNPQLAQLLAQQEGFARASCVEYECNQGDYTMFGTPDGTSYRPYQPYRALNRL